MEGTAAGYEAQPRADADQALQQAAKDGNLIPIATLCRAFPTDEGPALLAYAESKSFVGYLREAYGLAGIRQALQDYAAGADCPQGMVGSTGKTLDALEQSWRAGLTGHPTGQLTTWMVVLGAFVMLLGVLAVGWVFRRRWKSAAGERKTAE